MADLGDRSSARSRTQMLGEFRLVKKIGQGGMGAVYEATQVKLDRRVALKVLPQKYTDDAEYLERFQREAKSAAALNHSNIIHVYDIGEEGGYHFFAMELVDGDSVQDLLEKQGKLPQEQALSIVEGAAKDFGRLTGSPSSTGTSSLTTSCSTRMMSRNWQTWAWRSGRMAWPGRYRSLLPGQRTEQVKPSVTADSGRASRGRGLLPNSPPTSS